jgi:aspartyl-tRNA(Asn)/glutamyl-tRNA(Gln) amidotransferase subunit A
VTDPTDLGLSEAADAIARKVLSPLELTEACLARARLLEPRLRAFTYLDESGALAAAKVATEEVARGHLRGPLHGVPVAVKDLIDVAGMPTTASSRVLADNVPDRDAPLVARLRAAGALILGKTNTQEFALGVVTPPTCNPWDKARIPGGSSGGSAVAVAAGMALGALGSDTAGSIRIPSALCGISGLKPCRGSLPLEGVIPLSWTLDVCGPMAAGAVDLERMWRALAGSGPIAPATGVVIATPDPEALGEVEPDVLDAAENAVETLCRAGARRLHVTLPPFKLWDRPRNVLIAAEALAAHRGAGWYPDRANAYGDEMLACLRRAESLSALELVEARRTMEGLEQGWRRELAGADVLALPTTMTPAPGREELTEIDVESSRPEVVLKLTRLCGPVNWCGLASVSVPCGFSRNLPIALQLVARDEATALGAALLYQTLTDFHTCRPPA